MSDPRRKFFLLIELTKALGPDLSRRELSVAQLEQIAAEHDIDTKESS